MSPAAPKIKSHKPSGRVPWPLVLLEGEEKSGKSYALAELSASPRVGMCYWIDLGEGSSDEYGAIPGAEYEVIDHDGSYGDILEQITAVYWEAKRAADAGEPPTVLGIDTMTAMWRMLTNWTNDRAKRSRAGQRALAADPDAEVSATSNLWNDANGRHRRVLDLLQSFPGIVIITARGKDVAVMGSNGQPIEGRKEWKVEGQKELAFEASVWIRMFRAPRRAQLIGGRGLKLGQMDGKPLDLPDFSLEEIIFDRLGVDAGTQVRNMPALRGDEMTGLFDLVFECKTEDALKALYVKQKVKLRPDDLDALNGAVTTRLEVIRLEAAGGQQTPPAGDVEKLRQAAEKVATKKAPTKKAAAKQDDTPPPADELPPEDPWDTRNMQEPAGANA